MNTISSSDSDDDCYGNVAKKLQHMKNRYQEDKFESTNLLNESVEIDKVIKDSKTNEQKNKNVENNIELIADVSETNTLNESEDLLDEIIADNLPLSALKKTRSRRKKRDSNANQPPKVVSRRKTKKNAAEVSDNTGSIEIHDVSIPQIVPPARNRGSRHGRGRSRPEPSRVMENYPTFSVGNTYEYPDQCADQQLFCSKPNDEVILIEDNNELDDNEELSVKVYWQSSELFKFSVRKFQKLTQIFQYFSKKENVSFDNLLFQFNDKILKPDDTPDSISYNIGKFIDGGIVNKNVSKLVQKSCSDGTGIKIKFQAQNIKKPFEITVNLDERLSIALLKCSEELEKPLNKLKFVFDGEPVLSHHTPRELEFEGGECIDVVVLM